MSNKIKSHLQGLADKWPSTIVSRDHVGQFTGGLISSGRMANLDCIGEGPAERIRIGRKIAYPVGPYIEWLSNRVQAV